MTHQAETIATTTTSSSSSFKKGMRVATLYGDGVVEIAPRPEDGICVVHLSSWGGARLYTNAFDDTNPSIYPIQKMTTPTRTAMSPAEQFHAALESFEKGRKLNLVMKIHPLPGEIDPKDNEQHCSVCLRQKETFSSFSPCSSLSSSSSRSVFFGGGSGPNRGSSTTKRLECCLLCGSPICFEHTAKQFSSAKEKVFFCVKCEELLRMELDIRDDPATLRHKLGRLVVAYEQGHVLLQNMCQILIPALTEELNSQERADNHMALGQSSSGVLAGVLGFVGAALIFTPYGAPLLLGSLALGTSGTAVGLGYAAKKKYWTKAVVGKPSEKANRIIAIHSILQSILVKIVVFRENVQRDSKMGTVVSSKDEKTASGGGGGGRNQYLEALSHGANATCFANTGFQLGTAAAAGQATFATDVFTYFGLAPGVDTIFSALMIGLNWHQAKTTLSKIHTGSKSEKAQALTNIETSLSILPTPADVETDVQDTLRAMQQTPSQVEAIQQEKEDEETSALSAPTARAIVTTC